MNVCIDYLAMGFNFICDRIIFVTTMPEVKFQAIPQWQRKDYSTRKWGIAARPISFNILMSLLLEYVF